MTATDEVDDLQKRIREVEIRISACCDLIPIANWGFDQSVQEKLRQRKHRMVNQMLSKEEKSTTSNLKKQRFARSLGGVCTKVTEVLEWMGGSVVKDVNPKVNIAAGKKTQKKPVLKGNEAREQLLRAKQGLPVLPPAKKPSQKKPAAPESSDSEEEAEEKEVVAKPTPKKQQKKAKSDSDSSDEEEVAKPTPKKLQKKPDSDSDSSDEEDDDDEADKPQQSKPVATVKPTPRQEKKNSPDLEKVQLAAVDEDDSTDDEGGDDAEVIHPTPVSKKTPAEKRKATGGEPNQKKKLKLDNTLKKLENVDTSSLDPVEARQIAVLKLQQKIEEMKLNRKGGKKDGGKNADLDKERKLKRRASKLKMKQRRAEEKKKKTSDETPKEPTNTSPVKTENLPRTEEGNIVYSKFDFIIKDDKKRRLSTSQKKEKFTGKDYKSLLNKVEKRDEKLEKLKQSDPERAKEMENDIKWNRALKKAEGVKVKDNPELLKKGLKRKEKNKEKRLEKWSNRVEKIKSEQSNKQDKRNTNLQKRIDDKKKKKLQKLRSKGRIL